MRRGDDTRRPPDGSGVPTRCDTGTAPGVRGHAVRRGGRTQVPVNFGGRFSRKAFMPSLRSFVEASRPKNVAS